MTATELLIQLKDIQPPPEPSWWLLASGQWLVLVSVPVLLGAAWWWQRRCQANRLTLLASIELDRIKLDYKQSLNSTGLAVDLSRWLRQVALLAYPDRNLQSLCGDRWLAFLDQSVGDDRFSRGCGHIFGNAIYQSQIRVDADQVLQLCEHWLQTMTPRLQQWSRAQ
jgi:hypothetical protein